MPAVQITTKQATHMVACICINIITIHRVQPSITIPQLWYSSFLFHRLYVPISEDLCYVDLILENIEDTYTHPTPPSELKNISTGTVLPPVLTFLMEKIELGAFTETGDLIPTRLDTACLKLRRSVTNINEWLQTFAVYVSVIAKKTSPCSRPHGIPDSDSGSQQ